MRNCHKSQVSPWGGVVVPSPAFLCSRNVHFALKLTELEIPLAFTILGLLLPPGQPVKVWASRKANLDRLHQFSQKKGVPFLGLLINLYAICTFIDPLLARIRSAGLPEPVHIVYLPALRPVP